MARRTRAEVEGGLYHVLTRGNNRQRIFHSPADYRKFLSLLAVQKTRLPFFLYAYSLMTNHVHLLIERRKDAIGRIMHRLLTGYSQYYNRRYRRVGHLLQGRYKAKLCQSDRYLCELVRYIHLNPVRAGLVTQPEQYPYSGHAAYLGLASPGIVDVDPVLRHFGVKKKLAREAYRQFVNAGMKLGHRQEFYLAEDGILGSKEFVDATIHRIGETKQKDHQHTTVDASCEFNAPKLVKAIERLCGISRKEFCSRSKNHTAVQAKELFILAGLQLGASGRELSELIGIGTSTVSRRADVIRMKAAKNAKTRRSLASILQQYRGDED